VSMEWGSLTESTVNSRQSTGETRSAVGALLDLCSKRMKHSGDFLGFHEDSLDDLRLRVTEISTQNQEITGLREGSFRDIQKASVVLLSLPLGSLRDVRWNRNGRPAQLRDQTEPLIPREFSRHPIDLEGQDMASLPDLQVLELLHDWDLSRATVDCRLSTVDSPSTSSSTRCDFSSWPRKWRRESPATAEISATPREFLRGSNGAERNRRRVSAAAGDTRRMSPPRHSGPMNPGRLPSKRSGSSGESALPQPAHSAGAGKRPESFRIQTSKYARTAAQGAPAQ